MGDIQSGRITKGFGWMKATEIHCLWVTEWAIIEEISFNAGWMKATEIHCLWVTEWAIIEEISFNAVNVNVGIH